MDAFRQHPVWTMLDDEAEKPVVSWKGAPFLFLQTHAFEWDSPVCRGDGKGRIPVFKLPITFGHKAELYDWQKSYYYHDHIWLGSGALEIPAYRQLADPESELSQEGRALSRILEEAAGLPTFYYLMRYWGRKRGESQRQCPGCGGLWRVNKKGKGHLCNFDFKCDKCRLVSHEARSPEGGRHAKIGDFK